MNIFEATETILSALYASRMAYYESGNLSVLDEFGFDLLKCTLSVKDEPEAIAMGAEYIACVLKNQPLTSVYYGLTPKVIVSADSSEYIYKRELMNVEFNGLSFSKSYPANIKFLMINAKYAMCLLESHSLHLHEIKGDDAIIFPEINDECGLITFAAMTPFFLMFATNIGKIIHFDLEEVVKINEYTHDCGIVSVFPQLGNGTKYVFIDVVNRAFINSPHREFLLEIQLSQKIDGLLWDSHPNNNYFITWAGNSVSSYIFSPYSISKEDCACTKLANFNTLLLLGSTPVSLNNGTLTYQALSGKLGTAKLAPYVYFDAEKFAIRYKTEQEQVDALASVYFTSPTKVFDYFPALNTRRVWTLLADHALRVFDVKFAKIIYRQILQDAGMVATLERIEKIENVLELKGHLAVVFGDFALAKVLN